MNATDVDSGPLVEVTTEPKLGALPSALVPEPSGTSTVIMSEHELRASHEQLQAEGQVVPPSASDIPALPAARSWHEGLASEIQDEDLAVPGEARSSLASSKALLIAGLIAIIAFSLYALPPTDIPEFEDGLLGNGSSTTLALGPQTAISLAPQDPSSLPQLRDKGTPVPAFLRTHVERVRFDKEKNIEPRLESSTVGAAIPVQKVTIVNIWATWCTPCKNEMPGLKQVFELSGWGHEVRFVPIEADDSSRQKAYAEFAPIMPEHRHYLAGTDVLDSLAADDAIKTGENLPITLLLDCRRQLRWANVGELKAPDIEALEGLVDELRAELSDKYCRHRHRPKKTPELVDSADSADPENSVDLGEPKKSQPPPNCGKQYCPKGDICNRNFNPPRCTAPASALRDG